jgi:hypothetical protein
MKGLDAYKDPSPNLQTCRALPRPRPSDRKANWRTGAAAGLSETEAIAVGRSDIVSSSGDGTDACIFRVRPPSDSESAETLSESDSDPDPDPGGPDSLGGECQLEAGRPPPLLSLLLVPRCTEINMILCLGRNLSSPSP